MTDTTDTTDGLAAIAAALREEFQTRRILTLSFPNRDGPDAALLPNRLSAHEALSQDFLYTVEVISERPDIPLKSVQGRSVTLALARSDGSTRYFNGVCFEFRLLHGSRSGAIYQMQLRPWLAYLRLGRDSRKFQGQSVLDITRTLLDLYSMRDWDSHLTGPDEPLTFACMIDDTHYNQLHLRWERRGWYYWYEHSADRHVLHLADNSTLAPLIDGDTNEVRYLATEGVVRDTDVLRRWVPVRQVVASQVAVGSFDYKNPRPAWSHIDTVNRQGSVRSTENAEFVPYSAKGGRDGDRMARQRMEEIEARGKHFEGEGDCRFLMPGRSFALAGHFDSHAANDERVPGNYVVLECGHTVQNNYLSGDGREGHYANTVRCIRREVVWRPGVGHNSTDVRVSGPQTATVVGPKGQEIYTDRYARIKVQFHWDRLGDFDERSSTWLRWVSPWTGKGYGFVGIPRIGQEVVVFFLNGEPDMPVVSGCLFNEHNLPAWDPIGQSHRVGLQTRSTPGGGGHNELVIHDHAGRELINILSQRDIVTTALRNHATVVQGPEQTVAVTTGRQSTRVHQAIAVESETADIQLSADTAIGLLARQQHVVVEAGSFIKLQVGKASIELNAAGDIVLRGVRIVAEGSQRIDLNP